MKRIGMIVKLLLLWGCVGLIQVMAISGIITVLLIHPNNCMCYTPSVGKRKGLLVIFPI